MIEDKKNSLPRGERPTASTASSSGALKRLGNYRLLQKIGEGGMGQVYEAEQEKPVRRKVALKLIKAGMDSEQVIARFEAERQALALMDHPSVAKVFDAGITPNGQPYFAMEFIQGIPITDYCARHQLTTVERLRLFIQICEGVQHAHQKAIIHRDLKPSNILVTSLDGKRVPKIIDFGVAKATTQKLTERSLFTELGVLIGTPAYMSPEQAEMTGENVDTRTDVYSLGVMLYELLLGALPLDSSELQRVGFDEIRRKIREQDPPRPSKKLSTLGGEASTDVARQRRTTAPALRKELSGDLDWITMRALEKDRTRRYGSPAELAADLQRHLNHQPVWASPPSKTYRARKFVRRHRVGVAAASAGAMVLLAFAVAMAVQASRIAAERDRANREADLSRRVSQFLVGLFEVSDPSEARGKSITALEILDRGAERIELELKDQPRIQTSLMDTMGKVYQGLGLHQQAQPLLREALDIRLRVLGPNHPLTLESINRMGDLLTFQGKLPEAESYYRQALEGRRRVLGNDHPDTLETIHDLGGLLHKQGKLSEAERYLREGLERRRRVLGKDHPDTFESLDNYGSLLQSQGKLTEAEPYYREALEGRRRRLGSDHPDTLNSINNMGYFLAAQGKFTEAEPFWHEALGGYRQVLGTDHPHTLIAMNNMGYLLQAQGKLTEAVPYWRAALEGNRRVLGNEHPDTLNSINNMGYLLEVQGKLAEAESLYLEAVETRRQVLGDDHPDTLKSINNLGSLRQAQNRFSEAEVNYQEALEGRRRALGEDHPDTLTSLHDLGTLWQAQDRLSDAEAYLQKALEGRRHVLGDDHPHTLASMSSLAHLYASQAKYTQSESLFEEALERARRVLPREHILTGEILSEYGGCLIGLKKYQEAEEALLEAHEILSVVLGSQHAETQKVIPNLVNLYRAWGKPDKVAGWGRKSSP